MAVKIHDKSRGSAGTRTIAGKLSRKGENVGRYKAKSLINEADLTNKQPHTHRYIIAENESKIAPNRLNREFKFDAPNKVRYRDLSYIWAGTQWMYLAVVMDLFYDYMLANMRIFKDFIKPRFPQMIKEMKAA